MNFTPSIKIGPAISGILTITVVGMIGWSRHSAPAPAPIVVPQAAVQSDYPEPLVRVVDPAPAWASAPRPTVGPRPYQPVSHYYGRSNHHSRRKSAAIIGGSAAGGALIGGLAGGGKGAVIGGLVGGGGGYLYNRHRLHHHRYRR